MAVVLAVRSHGEADKIVTFYGREIGKRNGIAKGAQRSRVRFVNKLEIFSLLEMGYEESRTSGLVRIDQAELLQPFAAIRGNYPAYIAASLVGELLQAWCEEGDPDEQVFALLVWALQAIAGGGGHASNRNSDPEQNLATVIFFELKLLTLLGYRPDLSGCRLCGNQTPVKRCFHFSLAGGGLTCPSCERENQRGLITLSLATTKILGLAQDLAAAKLTRLRLPPASGREALNFLHHYSRHLLQREIHSRSSLAELLTD